MSSVNCKCYKKSAYLIIAYEKNSIIKYPDTRFSLFTSDFIQFPPCFHITFLSTVHIHNQVLI